MIGTEFARKLVSLAPQSQCCWASFALREEQMLVNYLNVTECRAVGSKAMFFVDAARWWSSMAIDQLNYPRILTDLFR